MPTVLLLMPTTSYRAPALLEAAAALRLELVVGTDRKQALEEQSADGTIAIDLGDLPATLRRVAGLHHRKPLAAILGVDDETVVAASEAASALGLRSNAPEAVRAARDKYRMRQRLEAAGARGPAYRLATISSAATVARDAPYPCVLKPRSGAASRGVLRADDAGQFVAAAARIARIFDHRPEDDGLEMLVEAYLPGDELAVEGILQDGALRVLALFDKPDPMEGPTFEETIYTTPSRRSEADQNEVARCVQEAVTALGLRHGPIHAEVRLHRRRAILLEVAPRCIGGLCSRVLRFAGGVSLEELVLRDAVGEDVRLLDRESDAAGVMMIPVPRAGILRAVSGVDSAAQVGGIREITISIAPGQAVAPPPEGHRYLGFIFASAGSAADAEAALRQAHARLRFTIAPAEAG